MRTIASCLFVASISLLFGLYHALGRLEAAECATIDSQIQIRGPWQPPLPPGVRPVMPQQTHVNVNNGPQFPRFGETTGKQIHLPVVGRPQTDQNKAYQAALTEAREQIVAGLRELKPDLQWEGPRSSQLERWIIRKNTSSEYMKPPVDAVMWTTKLEIELSPHDQHDLMRHVRLEDAGARQLFLLKPLLAVIAILLTIAGYYRLEDLTKGYYTLLLRISAGLIFALAAASIYLLI